MNCEQGSRGLPRLTDLEEDVLTHIAAYVAAEDPFSLYRLCAVARVLRTLFIVKGASSALAWQPALKQLGWPLCDGNDFGVGKLCRPSAKLYRALSDVSAIAWASARLKCHQSTGTIATSDGRLRILSDPTCRLDGLTGAACCCLHQSLLLFGGTLNGNAGPVFGDLLLLQLDAGEAGCREVTVQRAAMDDQSPASAIASNPGRRRGHSLTATTLANGTPVAVLLGGWGYQELSTTPHILTSRPAAPGEDCADGRKYSWTALTVAGEPPSARAFHSATEVAPGQLLVYGGLGPGCCYTDVVILDLHRLQWLRPSVEGTPSCLGGRAGHGAAFFRNLRSGEVNSGELLLMSGASRSQHGDTHQGSMDAIEVRCSADGVVSLLRWSSEPAWAPATLPAVRTASYAVIGRNVLAWGGISETHVPLGTVHSINVDRRKVQSIGVADQYFLPKCADDDGCSAQQAAKEEVLPAPRGGALCFSVGPNVALLLCGSAHDDTVDTLTPYLLHVPV